MSDLPQSRTIYRRGMKYKATVATARIKQANRERKGTVQLNMLWRNHVRVSLSEAGKLAQSHHITCISGIAIKLDQF